jgi:hypothetical protein
LGKENIDPLVHLALCETKNVEREIIINYMSFINFISGKSVNIYKNKPINSFTIASSRVDVKLWSWNNVFLIQLGYPT